MNSLQFQWQSVIIHGHTLRTLNFKVAHLCWKINLIFKRSKFTQAVSKKKKTDLENLKGCIREEFCKNFRVQKNKQKDHQQKTEWNSRKVHCTLAMVRSDLRSLRSCFFRASFSFLAAAACALASSSSFSFLFLSSSCAAARALHRKDHKEQQWSQRRQYYQQYKSGTKGVKVPESWKLEHKLLGIETGNLIPRWVGEWVVVGGGGGGVILNYFVSMLKKIVTPISASHSEQEF